MRTSAARRLTRCAIENSRCRARLAIRSPPSSSFPSAARATRHGRRHSHARVNRARARHQRVDGPRGLYAAPPPPPPPPAQLRRCGDVASAGIRRSLHALQDADGRVTVLAPPPSRSRPMRRLHTLRFLQPPSPTSSRVVPQSHALTFISHIRSLHYPQRARRPVQARRLRRSSRAQGATGIGSGSGDAYALF